MNKYNKNVSFLGRGWGFPPTFSIQQGGIEMLDGIPTKDNKIPIIERSIEVIVQTIRGTRVMQPTFGCNLQPFIMENINLQNSEFIKKMIKEAITLHEPRIILEELTLTEAALNGKLEITVFYRVITTNTKHNVVFPFYRNEATILER
jgi:uncharacterized protein